MLRQKKLLTGFFRLIQYNHFGYTAKQTTAAELMANFSPMHAWYTNSYDSFVMQRCRMCKCEVIGLNVSCNYQVTHSA